MSDLANRDNTAGAVAPNAMRLLLAGFMAILAAGIGFSIRGGILDNWGSEFGFSGEELGKIGGGGMTGFCFGIIFGGIIVDRVGYGRLVIAAFLLHLVSAVITFAPYPGMSKDMVFNCLFWGSFIFAMANGTLEAVANPLVATLFPNNRMHYLNILHASWPAGLVLGSAMGWVLDDIFKIDWKIQLGLFLIPTLFYGVLFLGQKFPKSEASQRGLTLGEMFRDVGVIGAVLIGFFLWMFFGDNLGPTLKSLTDNDIFSGQIWGYLSIAVGVGIWLFFSGLSAFAMGSVLLFILFITHALVGAVELGTDGWIQNITGNILSSEQGKILFVFTSMTMFALRFCAHFIETRLGIKPIALLMICAALACLGLRMTSSITTFGGALVALTVYGIGKTFFWPTMLAVASDRFPRTGAVAMSIMGGLGMFSAGLLGSPGLGYAKDRFAGEALKANPAIFEQYKAEKPSSFLFLDKVPGIDAKKLGDINKKKEEKKPLTTEETQVLNASIEGDRKTLIADSFIPLTMAVIYLLLLVYFSMIGGYKPVHIDGDGTKGMRSNT